MRGALSARSNRNVANDECVNVSHFRDYNDGKKKKIRERWLLKVTMCGRERLMVQLEEHKTDNAKIDNSNTINYNSGLNHNETSALVVRPHIILRFYWSRALEL